MLRKVLDNPTVFAAMEKTLPVDDAAAATAIADADVRLNDDASDVEADRYAILPPFSAIIAPGNGLGVGFVDGGDGGNDVESLAVADRSVHAAGDADAPPPPSSAIAPLHGSSSELELAQWPADHKHE